jgi:hypothetical protein
VPDLIGGKRRAECFLVEMRVRARSGDGADVDDVADLAGTQQLGERADAPRRVPDREEGEVQVGSLSP